MFPWLQIRPVVLLALLAALFGAGAPAGAARADAPLAARVERYLAPLTAGGGFSGRVLVGDADSVLYEGGFGPAGALGPDARYRLGSLTKQFTALRLMQLADDGLLSPDDLLSRYLPDFPRAGDISLHQLLNHTAGVPDYTHDPAFFAGASRPRSLDEIIASFSGEPLLFEPGSAYSYSNSDYILLQAVVEKAGGAPLAAQLGREVFAPTGMDSSLLQTGADPPGLAPATVLDPWGQSRPFADWHPSAIAGAGAAVSSTRDMWLYNRALCTGALLSDSARQRMETPGIGGYAYGWAVTEAYGQKTLAHQGKWAGFSAYMLRLPASGLCVVVLANIYDAPTDRIAQDVLALALGHDAQTPSQPRPGSAPGAVVESLAGEYVSETGHVVTAYALDPALLNRQAHPDSNQRYLYASFDGSGPVQFFPRAGGGYYTLEAELTLDFSGPAGQPPDAVRVQGASGGFSARRR